MAIPVRIDHAGFYVSDVDASVAWYCEKLGLTLSHRGPVGAFLDVGDTILGLFPSVEASANLAQQHIAFAVEDIEVCAEALRANGVDIANGPAQLEAGYIAGQKFIDIVGPDGEYVEFVERPYLHPDPRSLHPSDS
jgi:catechol 2,3-dioxygenase-like lactoylglutathione lyase family enzyme